MEVKGQSRTLASIRADICVRKCDEGSHFHYHHVILGRRAMAVLMKVMIRILIKLVITVVADNCAQRENEDNSDDDI